APHNEILMADEQYEQEAYSWQMSRLASLEPVLMEYLEEAPKHLSAELARSSVSMQRDILQALEDLHGESAEAVLPFLSKPDFPHLELAVNTLVWSQDSRVAPA